MKMGPPLLQQPRPLCGRDSTTASHHCMLCRGARSLHRAHSAAIGNIQASDHPVLVSASQNDGVIHSFLIDTGPSHRKGLPKAGQLRGVRTAAETTVAEPDLHTG